MEVKDLLPREIVKRDVKHPRLEVQLGKVIVILPLDYDLSFAEDLVEKHRFWIMEKHALLQRALEVSRRLVLEERSFEEFKDLVHSLVREYSQELGVEVNRVFFRKMKTRWGSCTGKRNITINSLARVLPEELIKYIVYHEVCHLAERRHNSKFWSLISQKFPDFEEIGFKLLAYRLKLDGGSGVAL